MIAIDQLQTTRTLIVGLGDGLGDSIDRCPPGFANHPLWNLGHLVVTLRLLAYKLSGLPVELPEDFVRDFTKGSDPKAWTRSYGWAEVREQLLAQPAQLRADYDAGRFERFTPYTTSAGVALASIEAAIAFNGFHEGIHLGYVLAQRKALAAGSGTTGASQ